MEIKFQQSPSVVQEAAWVTIGKTSGQRLSPKGFHTYLISEHSPIKRLILSWRIRNLERRAMTHLVRHTHTLPFVATSRPDLTGGAVQKDEVDVLFDSNCQALIDMAKKRLCLRAWPATRNAVADLKRALLSSDDAFMRELGSVLVPSCVYRCGCPEGSRGCGYWKKEMLEEIEERYARYNEEFLRQGS